MLLNGDSTNWGGLCDCIFMDPPDNIGLKYDEHSDKRPDYIDWLTRLILRATNLASIVWVSYNAIHDMPLKAALWDKVELWGKDVRTIMWFYTFSQYNNHDFAHSYRPILMIRNPGYGYPNNILEESERMRLGDKRAAGPRVPGDVWEFPRVTGNSIERQSWHPTQHPVIIYDRIMKFSCAAGDTFVDYFAGTGTCFRAGLLNPEVRVIGIEKSVGYCENILRTHRGLQFAHLAEDGSWTWRNEWPD